MPKRLKRLLIWLLAAFLLYAVFTAPDKATTIVGTAWDIVKLAAGNLAVFFNSLLNR